jgi:hypothetical protein
MFLRNVGSYLPNCTASHTIQQQSLPTTHISLKGNQGITLKMEAAGSSVTLTMYQTAQRHVPEDSNSTLNPCCSTKIRIRR